MVYRNRGGLGPENPALSMAIVEDIYYQALSDLLLDVKPALVEQPRQKLYCV
jgi:hypothetical protein